MKYGDKFESRMVDRTTKESYGTWTYTYKRAEWHEYHTNYIGEGLWRGDKQLLGTCQFSVTGCQTEKAAKAKIRDYVKKYYEYDEED